jgi:hypothetical protein
MDNDSDNISYFEQKREQELSEYYKRQEQKNNELVDAILFILKPAFWIAIGYIFAAVTL